MDPQVPRFYRFLLTFTRVSIGFGITFFAMRYQNGVGGLVAYLILGSLMYLPLPSSVFDPVRSMYQLLKPRVKRDNESDIDDIEERLSNVWVDTSIPIKLLFLLNAMKLELIIKDGDGQFWSGTSETVGRKLLELEPVSSAPESPVQVTEKPLVVDVETTRHVVLAENMSEADSEVQMRKVNDETGNS